MDLEQIKQMKKYLLLKDKVNTDDVQVPSKPRTERPMEKGIVIKEVCTNSDRPVTKFQTILNTDRSYKGKERLKTFHQLQPRYLN